MRKLVLMALPLAFFLNATAFAATTDAAPADPYAIKSHLSITGTVRGPNDQDKTVPADKATVLLRQSDGSIAATYTVGPRGLYSFYDIDPGTYSLVAQMAKNAGPQTRPFSITRSGKPVRFDLTVPRVVRRGAGLHIVYAPVFFATDRTTPATLPPTGVDDGIFSNVRDDHLCAPLYDCFFHYGLITPGHPALPALANDQSTTDIGQLATMIAATGKDELVVFVHGYNNGFTDAYNVAAQDLSTMSNGLPVLFYSWPSNHAFVKYFDDETNNRWAETHFQAFLWELATAQHHPKKIHIIAHSMGNRLALAGIETVATNTRARLDAAKLGQLIFIAPDVDAATFYEEISQLSPLADRMTIYMSNHDFALSASRHVHGHYRAGQVFSTLPLSNLQNVSAIDASEFSCDLFGHSYWNQSTSMGKDIGAVLRGEAPMQQSRTYLTAAAGFKNMYAFNVPSSDDACVPVPIQSDDPNDPANQP